MFMKPTGLLITLRTGAHLLGIALARFLAGAAHVNDQTVNDLPQCPMGGLGQSGNGLRFGSLISRDGFTKSQRLTVSGSAAL
jgi:benzaldehyde dehydrogenase (NAD)